MFQRVSSIMFTNPKLVKAMALATLAAGASFAQPTPIPTAGDAPCAAEPTGAALTDTVPSEMDGEGYYSLFNGTDFKGWWQSCLTLHSNGSTTGGIFRVSPEEKAIFLSQRNFNGIGGLLMTKKKFDHYELVFDYWSDYRNDGGIFNRTPANGQCMQTVLDFIDDAAVGGTWGEGSPPPVGRDFRPWKFSQSVSNIIIPGNANGEQSNWTVFTSKRNPTTFGCPATGCTKTEWNALFDMNGWNQWRIQFYGGITGGQADPIKMKTWFRKVGSPTWVPVMFDTTIVVNRAYPAGYIGLQIHNGNRFNGPKGAWYRNIKWRKLNADGSYAWTAPSSAIQDAKLRHSIRATSKSLVGTIDSDYEIVVTDLKGKIQETFSGKSGAFAHDFKSNASGWLSVRVKTAHGVETHQVMRDR